MCLMLLLGMSGCSSKMTDPEKIYKNLEGKEYTMKVTESSGSKDVYIKGASDFNIIYMDEANSKIKTLVISDSGSNAYMYMDNNGTVNEVILSGSGSCQINYSDGKDVENTNCSDETREEVKTFSSAIKQYFKEIKTDGKGLFETAKWYADNNSQENAETPNDDVAPAPDDANNESIDEETPVEGETDTNTDEPSEENTSEDTGTEA